MKRFVIYLSVLLVVLIGVECLLSFIPNNYSYKRNYIDANSERINTLILGASHAENCINPRLLGEGAFNLGGSGKPYYYDAAIVKEYISKLPNLRLIIMTLAPFQQYRSYKHNIAPDDNLSALEPYIRCMHLKYFGIHYDRLDYWYYFELPNNNGNIYTKLINGVNCDDLGYSPLDTLNRISDWRHNQLPRPIDYSNEELPEAYKENVKYLKEMVQLCKENNVKLVFVSVPYLDIAQQALPEIDMKGIYEMIDELKVANPDLEYINYIYDERFEEKDFFNAVHLSKEGTDKFTTILFNDLNMIMNNKSE